MYSGIQQALDDFAENGFIEQDIANIQAVSRNNIIRVFNQYVYNQPAIVTSFVTKGQPALVLTGSSRAPVEEEIVAGNEPEFEEKPVEFTKTSTVHDRPAPAGEAACAYHARHLALIAGQWREGH